MLLIILRQFRARFSKKNTIGINLKINHPPSGYIWWNLNPDLRTHYSFYPSESKESEIMKIILDPPLACKQALLLMAKSGRKRVRNRNGDKASPSSQGTTLRSVFPFLISKTICFSCFPQVNNKWSCTMAVFFYVKWPTLCWPGE